MAAPRLLFLVAAARLDPFGLFFLYYERCKLFHAQLYVDIFLLLLDKSQRSHLLSLMHADHDRLSWLNRQAGDRILGHFYVADLSQI